MGDQAHRFGEQRADARRLARVLDVRLPHQRLHRDAAIPFVNPVQTLDPVDVDQMLGPREAEVEQRDERLAAGQHLRVLERGQHRARLVDRGRRVVLERGGLHRYSTMATARHSAASPPWKRHGKHPSWIFLSSTSSNWPPRFSMCTMS